MTNVSKRSLPKEEFVRLDNAFNSLVAQLDAESSSIFFNALLGAEEKVMLVKRLAAVALYVEGNSSYRVAQALDISPSTAERIRLDFDDGRYSGIEKLFKQNRTGYLNIWKVLETVLQAGMPPQGRGRWKSVFGTP